MFYLIFDIETTDAPRRIGKREIYSHIRMVQIAWQVYNSAGELVEEKDYIIKPEGYVIPGFVSRIHGITTDMAMSKGLPVLDVLPKFFRAIKAYSPIFVGHNIDFDINVLQSELSRLNYAEKFFPANKICTMRSATDYCKISSNKPGYYKWPNLGELYMKLFGKRFDNAHHALDDVKATAECFFKLIELNVVKI